MTTDAGRNDSFSATIRHVRDDISDGQRNKPGTLISGSFLPLLAAVARRLVRAPDERIRVDPSAAGRRVRYLAVVRSRKHSRSDGNPPEWEHAWDEPAVRTISELLFLMRFPGDTSAIPCLPGGTRRTLFGAPDGGRTRVFPDVDGHQHGRRQIGGQSPDHLDQCLKPTGRPTNHDHTPGLHKLLFPTPPPRTPATGGRVPPRAG